MRPAIVAVGTRVRRLREAVGLSQQAFADRGSVARVRIVHLEAGRNKGSSHEMRCALARAFGLPLQMLDGYLEGRVELARAAAVARQHLACEEAPSTGTGG